MCTRIISKPSNQAYREGWDKIFCDKPEVKELAREFRKTLDLLSIQRNILFESCMEEPDYSEIDKINRCRGKLINAK